MPERHRPPKFHPSDEVHPAHAACQMFYDPYQDQIRCIGHCTRVLGSACYCLTMTSLAAVAPFWLAQLTFAQDNTTHQTGLSEPQAAFKCTHTCQLEQITRSSLAAVAHTTFCIATSGLKHQATVSSGMPCCCPVQRCAVGNAAPDSHFNSQQHPCRKGCNSTMADSHAV